MPNHNSKKYIKILDKTLTPIIGFGLQGITISTLQYDQQVG